MTTIIQPLSYVKYPWHAEAILLLRADEDPATAHAGPNKEACDLRIYTLHVSVSVKAKIREQN